MALLQLDRSHNTRYCMESSSCPETLPSSRIKAIQELANGEILTNKLREMLGRPEKIESDLESVNGVVAQILGMFDSTLSILSPSNLKLEDSDESVKTKRGCYKRRKNVSTKTKITSGLSDDGYAWRKYGQKTILNLIHQRNYYRCSYKFEQGCQATKQVQKTNDEPPKYKTTYNGFHTCNNLQRTPQIIMEAPNPEDNSPLISFETNTLVENNKVVGTCFQSMKHTPPLKREQASSTDHDHHIRCDPIVGLSSEPMSMMSSGLDCEDMVSSGVFSSTCSTHGYDDDMIELGHDLDDFFVELCP